MKLPYKKYQEINLKRIKSIDKIIKTFILNIFSQKNKNKTLEKIAPIELTQVKSSLERYLQFYVQLEEPEYAVLITGPWGSGKTYQVLRCLPSDRIYYVSLYGIDSIEQFHAEVLAAAAPIIHKIQDSASTVGKAAGEALGASQLGNLIPKAFNSWMQRNLQNHNVLVFDDLERSNININDLLGAINFYVEHKKFKVIAIAHNEKMVEEFLITKEKIFGQSIKIESYIKEAFNSFVSKTKPPETKAFIENHEKQILNIFNLSQVESLRILRHIIEDLNRFHLALNEKYLEKPDALRYVVEFFVAMNIEVRAGRLSEVHLRNRYRTQADEYFHQIHRANPEQPRSPLTIAATRYSHLRITDTHLNDFVLVEMIIHGNYESESICTSLDSHPDFTAPSDLRPWQVIINFDKLNDRTVKTAIETMENELKEFAVDDPGELLHIFSLKMLLADENNLPQKIQEIENDAIQYIDHIATKNRLNPIDPNDSSSYKNQGYEGYSYWVRESFQPNFERVKNHLNNVRKEILAFSYKTIAKTLTEKMKTDPNHAIEIIRGDRRGSPYPFLQHVDPAEFANTWLETDPFWWSSITESIDARYANGRLEKNLIDEKKWLDSLHTELIKKAESCSGLSALRIKRAIPKIMTETPTQQ